MPICAVRLNGSLEIPDGDQQPERPGMRPRSTAARWARSPLPLPFIADPAGLARRIGELGLHRSACERSFDGGLIRAHERRRVLPERVVKALVLVRERRTAQRAPVGVNSEGYAGFEQARHGVMFQALADIRRGLLRAWVSTTTTGRVNDTRLKARSRLAALHLSLAQGCLIVLVGTCDRLGEAAVVWMWETRHVAACRSVMAELPSGTITFLFTDIEGSTRLLQEVGEDYQALLDDHHGIMRQAVADAGGVELGTEGDSFFVVFASARHAVGAVAAAQRALTEHRWPGDVEVRVRMGLHTGEAEPHDGTYVGLDVHRAARIAAAAHGGQVLLSGATRAIVEKNLTSDLSLRDLGEHRLRDIARPEHLYQLLVSGLAAEFPPPRSLDAPRYNLPAQLTRFVGRKSELAEIKKVLRTSRLLTLTGPGGTGKTRLALEVAHGLVDDFPDGVWFTELTPLTDPGLTAQAVATAMGAREQPGRPVVEVVTDLLRDGTVLLILDNMEHLLPVAAGLPAELLQSCSRLSILTTSRERLGIAGETLWRVPPLGLPEPASGDSGPSELGVESDAMQLFVERAVAVDPSFAITERNVLAVSDICLRLDGIPLAIELAAARLSMLSPTEIAVRLDDRLGLLTAPSGTTQSRQLTMRATVDWSYDLLTGLQRTVFARLSVFAGGFSMKAAEAVCAIEGADNSEVLDVLAQLVDRSMVAADVPPAGESRYRLLETLRQYAGEKLEESGKVEAAHLAHAEFFSALAEEAEPLLRGPDAAVWLRRLEAEHDNLRTALSWCSRSGDTETCLRLAGALAEFWKEFGHWSEGRSHLEAALSPTAGAPPAARVKALLGAVEIFVPEQPRRALEFAKEALALAREIGDRRLVARSLLLHGFTVLDRVQRADPLLREALELFRELNDRQGIADALSLLASANADVDPEGAKAWAEESVQLLRELEDQSGTADAVGVLAAIATLEGDYEQATRWAEERFSLTRDLGGKQRGAHALKGLGEVAHLKGDYRRATALLQDSLVLLREIGDRHCAARVLTTLGLAEFEQGVREQGVLKLREGLRTSYEVKDRRNVVRSLEGFSRIARERAEFERAARLLAAADAVREAREIVRTPAEERDHELEQVTARTNLGDEGFATAWDEGRNVSLDDAVAYALEDDRPPVY